MPGGAEGSSETPSTVATGRVQVLVPHWTGSPSFLLGFRQRLHDPRPYGLSLQDFWLPQSQHRRASANKTDVASHPADVFCLLRRKSWVLCSTLTRKRLYKVSTTGDVIRGHFSVCPEHDHSLCFGPWDIIKSHSRTPGAEGAGVGRGPPALAGQGKDFCFNLRAMGAADEI